MKIFFLDYTCGKGAIKQRKRRLGSTLHYHNIEPSKTLQSLFLDDTISWCLSQLFNMITGSIIILVMYFKDVMAESFLPESINSVFRGTRLSLQPELQANLASAVQLALENCQDQFKWDRWNCPETAFSHRSRGSTTHATKETAYTLAAISSAVTYVITKNCAKGNIPGCGCNPNIIKGSGDGDWVWGGCSEYTEYGEMASKKYLDGTEIGTDALTYSNLHNYNVGREVIKKSLKKRCKCHGMSGSCSIKICWNEMSPFRESAYQLRKRYDKAMRVDFEEGYGKVVIGNSVIGNTLSMIPKASSDNLIYLQESPNYCVTNNTTGWKGTLGRVCSRKKGDDVSASERKSCRHLCRKCGFTVKKKKLVVSNHCNCIFKWCCEVKCDTCTETVSEHFCYSKF